MGYIFLINSKTVFLILLFTKIKTKILMLIRPLVSNKSKEYNDLFHEKNKRIVVINT